jgi:hypothetical protein
MSLLTCVTTMMLAHALTGSAPAACMSHPAVDTLPFDTMQVVLTPTDLDHVSTFLSTVAKDSTWDKLRRKHLITYPMALGDVGGAKLPGLNPGDPIPIPDYTAVVTVSPAVAHAFTTAHLTPPRYMQLIRTLTVASVTRTSNQASHHIIQGDGDIVLKNLAFLNEHAAQFALIDQLANGEIARLIGEPPQSGPAQSAPAQSAPVPGDM